MNQTKIDGLFGSASMAKGDISREDLNKKRKQQQTVQDLGQGISCNIQSRSTSSREIMVG